ncbi:MAG: hypothetical protein ACUVS6_11810 [Anaerolineae bacterium]
MADLPAEIRQQQLQQLNNLLELNTIQGLRQAARLWHWPLRGTAKAEVVGQMLAYLSDPTRMAQAFQDLPENERAVLQWLRVLSPAKPANRPIQAALEAAEGVKVSLKAIEELLQDLVTRCLAFPDSQGSYLVPELYGEWLPGLEANKMRYAGQPAVIPSFTAADLSDHVQHLLLAIRADRPVLMPYTPPQRAFPGSTAAAAVARPCPVAISTLHAWGYPDKEEHHLVSFLLEAFLASEVCSPYTEGTTQHLKLNETRGGQLLEQQPDQLLPWLQEVCLKQPTIYRKSLWTELDLALHHVPAHFQLFPTPHWNSQEQLTPAIVALRHWLALLVAGLQADVWYSVESFCRLIYRLRRNLLMFESAIYTWFWHRDGKPLDPAQMPFEDWQATYGKLVEAWLRGPAHWLLIAQPGYVGRQLVAFRRYAQAPTQQSTPLPPAAVQVTAEDEAVVRNIPRTGRLRQIFRGIAGEARRDCEVTVYRLEPDKFRDKLLKGVNVDQLKQAFASTGYTLDERLAGCLAAWQARAGREQIYERVAIIEFSAEMHPGEVAAAAAALNAGPLYAVSPHCLVLLDPEWAQTALTQLRQRGYTPQVIV